MAAYYYKIGEKIFGPVEGKQLHERLKTGVLIPDLTWVRREDKERWVRADKLRLTGSSQSSLVKAWKPIEERIEPPELDGEEDEAVVELEDAPPPIPVANSRTDRPRPAPPRNEVPSMPTRAHAMQMALHLDWPLRLLVSLVRIGCLATVVLTVAIGLLYALVLFLAPESTVTGWIKAEKGFVGSDALFDEPDEAMLDTKEGRELDAQRTDARQSVVSKFRRGLIFGNFFYMVSIIGGCLVFLVMGEIANFLYSMAEGKRQQFGLT